MEIFTYLSLLKVQIWITFIVIYAMNGTLWYAKIIWYEIKIFGIKIYHQIYSNYDNFLPKCGFNAEESETFL